MSFKKNLAKKLSHTRGFSLLEIIMVMGMLGALGLVVVNLTKQTTKSSAKFQFDTDIAQITNEISSILSDPNTCLANFPNDTNVLFIKDSNNNQKYIKDGTAGAPAQGYGNSGVKISGYSLHLLLPNGPVNSYFQIAFLGKAILGSAPILKKIDIKAVFPVDPVLGIGSPGTNPISSCRSITSSSDSVWKRQNPGTAIYYMDGNVGVGTPSPRTNLHIHSAASAPSQLQIESTGADDGMYLTAMNGGKNNWISSGSSHDGTNWIAKATESAVMGFNPSGIYFAANSGNTIGSTYANTVRLSILNTGNVGIGMPNPTAKLEVAGSIKPGAAVLGATGCTPEGAFAYDSTTAGNHGPVYCNASGVWSSMGGTAPISGTLAGACPRFTTTPIWPATSCSSYYTTVSVQTCATGWSVVELSVWIGITNGDGYVKICIKN